MLAAVATWEPFGISYGDAAILEAARSMGCASSCPRISATPRTMPESGSRTRSAPTDVQLPYSAYLLDPPRPRRFLAGQDAIRSRARHTLRRQGQGLPVVGTRAPLPTGAGDAGRAMKATATASWSQPTWSARTTSAVRVTHRPEAGVVTKVEVDVSKQ